MASTARSQRRLTRAAAVVVATALVAVWSPSGLYDLGLSSRAVAEAATVTTVPSNLRVDVGNGKIFPMWSANTDGATGYQVQYLPYGTLGGVLVALGGQAISVSVSGANTRTTTISGLTNGTPYDVSIRAVYADGSTSAYSSVVTVKPTATVPAQPWLSTVSAGDTKVTLTWAAGTDSSRSRIDVYRNGWAIASVAVPATSYVDTSVTNGVTYSYSLVAVNSSVSPNVRSDTSPAMSATPVDLTPPAAPANVVGTPGDRTAALSWNPNTESDFDHYVVKKSATDTGTNVTTTSWSTSGLTNGTTYSFTVYAVDRNGNTSLGTTVSVKPVDLIAPDVPTGLVVRPGDTALDTSWTGSAATDTAAYRIYVNGTLTSTVPVGTTSARLANLVNGTSYSVQVSAVDAVGNESAKTSAVFGTPVDVTAPAAPTGLTAVAGDSRATLSWNANSESDLDHYLVRNAAGTTVASVPAGTTTAAVTGLTNGVQTSFTVVAVDHAGNVSPNSAAVTVMSRDLTPPSTPGGVAAVAGDGSVSLSWTASPESDVDHYDVRTPAGVVVATVTAPATAKTITGLTNGTTVNYVVVAVDHAGNASPASPVVSATPRDTTAPSAPTNVAGVAGDGQATVTWTASPESDVDHYVLRNAAGTTVATVPATSTSATATGLTNGVAASFTVVAVDGAGNVSPASSVVTLTPRDMTAPDAPASAAATAGDASATVTWTRSLATDVDHYVVLDSSGTARASVPANSSTATITGLTNGTGYTFSVVAVDAAGNTSTATPAGTVTPAAVPVPTPANVAATAGDATATVTWSAVADGRLDHYQVCQAGGTCTNVPAGTTTATFANLTNGTTYSYTVTAVATTGAQSAASAPATATPHATPPAAPTGVVAFPGDTTASVSWNPVSGASGYQVLTDDGRVVAVSGNTTTLTGLTNGRTYSVTVRALAADGTPGALSSPVQVTPAAVASGTPTPSNPSNPWWQALPAAPSTGGSGGGSGTVVSRDGSTTVFGTSAALEASDTNSAYELYVRNTAAGTVTRLDPAGAATDLGKSQVALSDDGRYAAVVTSASRSPLDTNTLADVYRVELSTGTWTLVSDPAGGTASATTAGTTLQAGVRVYTSGPSVAISGDGNQVFFFSARSDLVAGDTNGSVDLFRKNLTTGAVTRVSTTSTDGQLPGGAIGPALDVTPDGRYVLFVARPNNVAVLWRKDLQTGTLAAASGRGTWEKTTASYSVSGDAQDVSLSDDGRYVVFSSDSSVLTSNPGDFLVYRRDMAATNGFARAGMPSQSINWEHGAAVDPSGRYVFFATTANYGSDADDHTDWYRYDANTGTLAQVTSMAGGTPATTRMKGAEKVVEYGSISVQSADVVLVTTMQALVAGDANKVTDVYRKDLGSGAVAPLA